MASVLCHGLWLKWFVMTWDFSDLSWPHWAIPPAAVQPAQFAVRGHCLTIFLWRWKMAPAELRVCLLHTCIRCHVNKHASELSAWHSGVFFGDTTIAVTAVQCCLRWLRWNRYSRFQCCRWFYYSCRAFENTEKWLFSMPHFHPHNDNIHSQRTACMSMCMCYIVFVPMCD